jgi:hypothetical protein
MDGSRGRRDVEVPKVAVEDGIGLDLEDDHSGVGGRASRIDIGYAVYFFLSVAYR